MRYICISVCYGGCLAADKRVPKRIIDVARKIIGSPLLSLEGISNSRCCSRAENMMKESTHPGYHLFELLPVVVLVLLLLGQTGWGITFILGKLLKINDAPCWQFSTYFENITFLYSMCVCVCVGVPRDYCSISLGIAHWSEW